MATQTTIQAELSLEGETVTPRAVWEVYQRDNPGWREAWWRRTIREGFRELRSSVPREASEDGTGAVWTVSLSAPWNTETDAHAEPAGMDESMNREAALEIARKMPLIGVLNSVAVAKDNLEYLTLFDWEPEPGRLYSCYVSGVVERNGRPQNGIQEFSRIIGVVFLSELVKANSDRPALSERGLLNLARGDLRRLEGDTSKLTAEELEQFWLDLDTFLQPEGELHAIEAPERSTAIQPAPSKANARQTRLLLDGVTRMDKRTDALIGLLDGRGLPRSWEKVRLWDDMVAEESSGFR